MKMDNQSLIIRNAFDKENTLCAQFFVGIVKSQISFWIQNSQGKHFSIKQFNEKKTVGELKQNNLAAKMLKITLFYEKQNLIIN